MEKLINKKSVLEVAKGFTFTDKTQEKQYMDFLEYCLDNAKDNSKPLTNADKIRNMTDEELAEFLRKTIAETGENIFSCDEYDKTEHCIGHMCTECGAYLAWLKSEVEEN